MKTSAKLLIVLSAAALSLAITARLRASGGASAGGSAGSSVGTNPVREILWAVPFRLEQPYAHMWRKEQPQVSGGYLLVLSVDPEYVRPRETAEPVLYAGDQTIERVNHGFESGRVVAILPAEYRVDGQSSLDLAATPFWFGPPDLPERVDAAEIRAQRQRAEQPGARVFRPAEIAAALKRGGEPLVLGRREDLEARAGLLVFEHAPDERDLADGLLVPSPK